ncbi:MAG: chromosomal replication initiator protein DnaA, partial [Patescibacteria group bacterium]
MTRDELWQTVLADLELSLSKANFTTWFKNTFVSEIDDTAGEIVIGVPNAFTQAWLEKKYHKLIFSAIREVYETPIQKINYRVETKKQSLKNIFEDTAKTAKYAKEDAKPQTTTPTSRESFGLNPKYTFDTFVVGEGSALAHAASMGAVNSLGKRYNPLFIYGGVGLGKTHLAQAIGNEILRKEPKKKVLYVSAEKFTDDYVRAIREGKMDDLKNKYRKVDVLIIDDIQFLSGKEQTQEEFFHTFNELHQRESQIVLTSDRLPQAIPTLEERLKSRFQMGVITDIAPPKLETRIAILERKINEQAFSLAPEVLQFLAANIQTNVRELEGALNKIAAYHEFYNVELSMDVVKKILSSLETNSPQSNITIRQVIDIVAEFYEIKKTDLVVSKCRRREVVMPRQIAMYLLRTELNVSYPTIGE